jgi:hypothetical protein
MQASKDLRYRVCTAQESPPALPSRLGKDKLPKIPVWTKSWEKKVPHKLIN